MQKLYGLAFFAATVLLVGCSPKMIVDKGPYFQRYIKDSIPYHLATHKTPSEKLLIYLGPALDTFHLEKSPLHRKIFNTGYDILNIYKPLAEGEKYYRRRSQDVKLQRQQDIEYLVGDLRKQKSINPEAKIVLFGIEEGAYLAPSIALSLNVDTCILVNGGPFSIYFQVNRLAEGNMEITEGRSAFLKRHFFTDSLPLLMEKVKAVEKEHPDVFSLGAYPNMYWLSYHLNFFIEEFQRVPGLVVYINFEDYPLFKAKDIDFFKVLTKMRPREKTRYHRLPGDGSFTEEQLNALEEVILPIFKD